MLIRSLLLGTALIMAAPAVAQDTTAPMAATAMPAAEITDPAQFATMAASSNMLEIESSTLALEQSQNEDVRAFAEQMIADHTAASEQMATAAAEEGVTPPMGLQPHHQEMLDSLTGLEGEQFDAAYMQLQVQAHDEAVALFETYSTQGEDGALKEFAVATLPVLEEHQEHAHSMTGH
ncbi:MAG TPA: DUF4142 domain-containing protein [Devosia sp.]|jgi:putative membrane protein|nr:DUF4142 domain-containing protein [Devosia sp.]